MVSKYEIKAKKELEAEGWLVDDKRGMGRFAKNRDFFNCFDLVAIAPGSYVVRWISIKGHKGIPTGHRQQIEALPLPPLGNQKEIWYWPKRKQPGWIKKIIY